MAGDFMFWGVVAFLIAVWLLTLNQFGHVEEVTEAGFVFKPHVGRRLRLLWSDVRGPVRIERRFMPRVTVGLSNARFTSVRPSLAVFLRFTPTDLAFVEQLQNRFGLREIKSLRDLF